MKHTLLIIFTLIFSYTFANQPEASFLNDAVYVAQVKSFSENGYLSCEFQCFLDLNYSDFEVAPEVYFQIGTTSNPIAYHNRKLSDHYLETAIVEKVFSDNSYKLKLNFGKISVKQDFVARIKVVINNEVKIIDLSATDFNNKITIMNEQEKLEDYELCKAEQFLRKIDFDRLYKE